MHLKAWFITSSRNFCHPYRTTFDDFQACVSAALKGDDEANQIMSEMTANVVKLKMQCKS